MVRIDSLYDFLELQEEYSELKDHIIDFSDGEILEEDLKKIAEIRGTDEKESFEFLKKCYKKGLFVINLKEQVIDGISMKTKDISKDDL